MSGFRAWTLVNGTFQEGATVPLTDRGFRYGMSVFETLAVRSGKILFLREHLTALDAACAAAGFQADKAHALGALEGLPNGMLRIYVTAGDGPPHVPCTESRVFAFFESAEFPGCEEVLRGARVTAARAPMVPLLGGWKTGNYWQRVQALSAARQNGFDETLILNIEGVVISAAMANAFFRIGGVLQTPATDAGARPGVVRAWIGEMTAFEETLLTFEDAKEASECFLTNSRLGVMPVSEIDGRRLPSRDTGEELAALYRERILPP